MSHLLMRQDVGTELPLFSLDELDVCLHAVLFEVLSEQIRNVGIRVQTRELSSARILLTTPKTDSQ